MYLRVEKPVCISSPCLPRKVQLLKCGFKTPPHSECSLITDLSCSQSGWAPGLPVSPCDHRFWWDKFLLKGKGQRKEKMTHPTSDHSEAHKGLRTLWRGLIPPHILLWSHWDQTQHSKHVDAGRFSVVPFVFLSQTLRIFFFINPSALMTWIRKIKLTSRFLFSVFLSTTWC